VSCHENLHHDNADAAVAGIADGSTILIGGFGMAGMPVTLIDALIRQGATELIVVNNNAGNGETGLAALLAAGRVRKMICSFPRQRDSYVFDRLYRDGKIELELVRRAASQSGCGRPAQASARSTLRRESVLRWRRGRDKNDRRARLHAGVPDQR
jgi:3-oxoacid CoA-transferase A subunit